MKISDLVETNVLKINVNDKLGDLVEKVKKAKRNIFAVVDHDDTFIGIISLEEIRTDMFDKEKYDNPVTDYLYQMLDDDKVSINEDLQEVMNKFNRTGNYNLMVIDNNRYIGLVSRANILKAYRENLLAEESDEKG
jgi:CIC family chloride channel protein